MKQNWSRRELEAFGEPLGDSVTQRKLGGGYICGGGGGKGGGGGGPQQTTAYQTNIPEYAKPYVTNMLEATQKQLFDFGTQGPTYDSEGNQISAGNQGEITGFKPYRPYSTDVNQYFAGFSPLQQQAQQAAYGLQTPSQFGAASNLAGTAGMRALGAGDQASALGQQALGYGATGAEYGGLGAQQALARAQQTARQAGMYGGMGAGYGARGVQAAEQGFGAGEAFARQATDPYATQAYMSPYMQNVIDYQKSQALRDYNIGRPMRARQAIGAGAFGGSRQAIAEAEAERGLMSQLQGITATGSQKAFEDAQRQQQFGAQLGLQGLQAGYGGLGMGMQGAGLGLQGVGAQQAAGQLGLAGTAQGIQGAQAGLSGVGQAIGAGQYGLQGLGQATQAAGTLGQLGGAQLGAQRDIIGLQSQMGAQQQAFEQQKINQAIQDYATQQQYPLMQLGFMSNMLRGLPMQATTTQTYQAMPSATTQGLGLLAGAAGAKQAGLFAEGGTIKGLASGGVAGYANRGMVQANPDSSVVRGIRQKLEMMPADQLQRVAQTSPSEEIRAMAIQILQEQKIREQAEAQAQQSIAQDQRGLPTPVTERAGLPAAPAGAMDMLNAASGGIVAFAGEDESLVEDETTRLQKEFDARKKYTEFYKQQREAAGIGAPKAALGEFYTKEQAALKDAEDKTKGYNLMDIGFNLATQTGPLMYAAGKTGKAVLPNVIAREEGLRGRRGEVAKGLAEVAEGERLMKLGDITGGNAMFEKAEERFSKEKIAGAKGPGNMVAYANNYLAEKVAAGDTRDPAVIKREGMDNYMYLYGQAGPRAATAATVATGNIGDKIVDANAAIDKNYNIKLALAKKADKPRIEAERDEEKRKAERIIREGGTYKAPPASAVAGGGGGKSKANPADFDNK